MKNMSKVPVEHTISGVRSYVNASLLAHPKTGQYLRPVRNTKPVHVFNTPIMEPESVPEVVVTEVEDETVGDTVDAPAESSIPRKEKK